MTENYLLEVKNVSKSFGVVKALNRIDFNVRPNEIHALCGENGAGKSTLMNILSGVYPYGSYGGEVYYDGELCKFRNVRESEKKNIAIIHQHLALFPALSIAENIFLGNENAKNSVADGLFCREIDGLFCRSSPDIIVRRRCVLSHKRRGWLEPSPSFRYSRNLALQDELYHPVINNGPAVLVCVDKRLGTGPVNQSRDAG